MTIRRFRTTKTGLLVAYLALTPPHRFPREFLADLLWGDDEPERARHSLNVAISALRHALEQPDLPAGQLIQTDRATVALNPEHFMTDVIQFEQALVLASGVEVAPDQCIAWLQRAVDLYRGGLLTGCYEPWAVEAAARYQAECLNALRLLTQLDSPTQRPVWLHRMLQWEPLDWQATEQLVGVYLEQGHVELARQVCDQYEAHWMRLYTEPPPDALRNLRRQCAETRSLTTFHAHKHPSKSPTRPRKQQTESQATTLRLPRSVDTFYGRTRELEQLWAWLIDGEARLVTLTGLGGFGKTRLALEFAQRVRARNPLPIWWVDFQAVLNPELLWNTLQCALGLPAVPNPYQQTMRYLGRVQGILVLDNFEQLLPEGAMAVADLLAHAPDIRLLITSRVPLQIAGEHLLALAPLAVEAEQDGVPAPAVQLFADRAQRVAPDFRLTPERLVQLEELCRRLDGIPLALELAAARAGILSTQQMLQRLTDRLSWLQTARRDLPARHRCLHAVLEACVSSLEATEREVWLALSVFRGDFTLDAAQAICPDTDLPPILEQLRAAGLLQSAERSSVRRLSMLETLREYARTTLTPESRHAAQQRLLEWILSEAQTRSPQQFDDRLDGWLAYWDAERENLLEALQIAEAHSARHHAYELLRCTQRYWMLRALHRFGEATLERLIPHLPHEAQAQARLLQAEWARHAQRHTDTHEYAVKALDLIPSESQVHTWLLYHAVDSAIVANNLAFVHQWGAETAQRALNADDPALQVAGRRIAIWYLSHELLEESTPYHQFKATAQAAQRLGDPLWIALALDDWIDHCMVTGRYGEALSLAKQSGAIATRLQDGVRLQSVAQAQGYCLMQLGHLHAAEQRIDESLYWAHLTGAEAQISIALKANLRRLQDDYEGALQLVQQTAETSNARSEAFVLEVCGHIERDRGDKREALSYYDRALQRRIDEGDPFRLHFARTHRAYAGCQLGDPDALGELQACLTFWREQDNSPWIATTLLYLAEIQIARGELEAARDSLAESLQRNRAMGRQLQQAIGCELWASLEEARGNVEAARHLQSEANRIRTALNIS
ncbi:MAG: winged helix-turn-helix domain-containing protein [Fimbriimonadales bacterium]|nr:winged helix-turn-helix domain-containing protein [Fimbriimonadales bacterium]